ncbi:MAG: hypothetical protein BJ554DRAFT_7722, partial [Olpidium bornovanus]
ITLTDKLTLADSSELDVIRQGTVFVKHADRHLQLQNVLCLPFSLKASRPPALRASRAAVFSYVINQNRGDWQSLGKVLEDRQSWALVLRAELEPGAFDVLLEFPVLGAGFGFVVLLGAIGFFAPSRSFVLSSPAGCALPEGSQRWNDIYGVGMTSDEACPLSAASVTTNQNELTPSEEAWFYAPFIPPHFTEHRRMTTLAKRQGRKELNGKDFGVISTVDGAQSESESGGECEELDNEDGSSDKSDTETKNEEEQTNPNHDYSESDDQDEHAEQEHKELMGLLADLRFDSTVFPNAFKAVNVFGFREIASPIIR